MYNKKKNKKVIGGDSYMMIVCKSDRIKTLSTSSVNVYRHKRGGGGGSQTKRGINYNQDIIIQHQDPT